MVPLNLTRTCHENARLLAGVLLCALGLLPGCALVVPQSVELAEQWPAALPERAEVAGVPFFADDDFLCGPATLATTLAYAGAKVEPGDLVPEVYLPKRRGALQIEMLAAARRHGAVSYALDGKLENVLREVAAGNPVIVLQDFGVWPFKVWHYAVVMGFDRASSSVVMRSGMRERQVAPWAALEYTWGGDHWAMVTMPPGRVPATAEVERYTEAVVAMARVSTPANAKAAYEALLARWPRTFTAEVGLANTLYALRDLPKAESLFRDALAQQPDSVPVLNNLAMVVGEQGRIDEALELVSAAERSPGPYAEAVAETRRTIEARRKR